MKAEAIKKGFRNARRFLAALPTYLFGGVHGVLPKVVLASVLLAGCGVGSCEGGKVHQFGKWVMSEQQVTYVHQGWTGSRVIGKGVEEIQRRECGVCGIVDERALK